MSDLLSLLDGAVAASLPAAPLRIALVEDDRELREAILRPRLEEAGFEVESLANAADLYRAMLAGRFDIVVLDIGLPDESGFDVARYLRSGSSVGIVMLTGRSGDEERVRGLNHGADAFLPKPVDLELLVATLHSLGRRLRMEQDRAPEAPAGWHLDARGWQLHAPNGASVQLTATERAVLRLLFDADGQPVSRAAIIAGLVGDDGADDFDPHRLEVLVHRLRRKVAVATRHSLPLRAIRANGYLLTLDERSRHRSRPD